MLKLFDRDLPVDSRWLTFATYGYIGRSRFTSSKAAFLIVASRELNLVCRSSDKGVPGYGALRLRLRNRCMPRVVSQANFVPNPCPHAFSNDSDVFML